MIVQNITAETRYFSFGDFGLSIGPGATAEILRSDDMQILEFVARHEIDGALVVTTPSNSLLHGDGDPVAAPAGLFAIYVDRLTGALWKWDEVKASWGNIKPAIVGWQAGDLSGSGAPTGLVTPDYIGQDYIDTDTGDTWTSTGLTNVDWLYAQQDQKISLLPSGESLVKRIGFATPAGGLGAVTDLAFNDAIIAPLISVSGAPSLLSLAFPSASSLGDVTISAAVLETISFPHLATIGTLSVTAGALTGATAALLTSATAISIPGTASTVIAFSGLTSVGGALNLSGNASMIGLTLTSLATVTGALNLSGNTLLPNLILTNLTDVGGAFSLNSDTALSNFTVPLLDTVTGAFTFTGCTSLVTVALTSLVTADAGINCSGCTSLTGITMPVFVPTNTQSYNFGGCALDEIAVDAILARFVANAGYVNGTLTLNGGTNAVPGVQGAIDAGVLTGRGVVVLVNV